MNLRLALQAFFKTLKEPEEAKKFLANKENEKDVDQNHLRLLALLQKSSRLIDFLKEDITQFSDAQVGSAVRKIHDDAAKFLEDLVTVRPLLKEEEGTKITVQKGYDSSAMRIIGKVKGEPPFQGIIRHKGWKAHKLTLPKQVGEMKREVISPAEIEVTS